MSAINPVVEIGEGEAQAWAHHQMAGKKIPLHIIEGEANRVNVEKIARYLPRPSATRVLYSPMGPLLTYDRNLAMLEAVERQAAKLVAENESVAKNLELLADQIEKAHERVQPTLSLTPADGKSSVTTRALYGKSLHWISKPYADEVRALADRVRADARKKAATAIAMIQLYTKRNPRELEVLGTVTRESKNRIDVILEKKRED